MLDKMQTKVSDIGVSQEQLTLETKSRLKEYRSDITRFKKEFSEKATKKEFAKTNEVMQENRMQFDVQFNLV